MQLFFLRGQSQRNILVVCIFHENEMRLVISEPSRYLWMFWREIKILRNLILSPKQFLVEQKCKWAFLPRQAFRATKKTFCKLFPLFHHSVFHITNPGRHHIKSDHIVSLMEQFASQFCQHRAFNKTPQSTMSAGLRTIRRHLFYPRCSLTSSSWLQIHTHALSRRLWWWIFLCCIRVGSVERHLVTWLPSVCLSVNSGSRQSVSFRRCEASLYKKTE